MIADGTSEALIVPALGAGLASYDLLARGGRIPLFRPCRDPGRAHPFELAHNLLLPWSGRVSGGGFSFAGRFHRLAPNLAGEPLPIHGNGFSSPWRVAEAAGTRAALTFASDGPGPYRFEARVNYALHRGALTVTLALTSRAASPLPHGLGFHPWFPRTAGTTLRAKAASVTLEDERHLPGDRVPVASQPDWDFSEPRRLPDTWVNNDFSPWDGRAEVTWPERGLHLTMTTGGDPHLTTFILYSPSGDAPFFCFEPVTHPVDAHNRPDGPEANGLRVLVPGETLSVGCHFVPEYLA